ncbi:serine/threonine protein kinase [Aliikangiella sp. IMCC44359]|uniref:serine/threonine protein kinase n=1 Tax=Aliikangiella sp. IMCC44359 TaxID=3459125 RepID=UPI00403AEAB8
MSAIEIPGYKIIRTLGVGGQATVYLAIQQGFDREVALKVMSPALAADPTFGERFIREAKIVAKLSHKSIVTVYDVGESGNFYYLAMEYMPGEDLKTRIAKGMKTRDCLSIISKLAKALHFAHDKGYIHRDVKSENILFDSDGEPVLTDFGIAKASNSSTQMTQTGKLIGTPEYMSPEQCRGKTVDGRSDLYSLGIILFEMLTRSVPYTGEDSVAVCIKHVTKPMPTLPARLNHYQWLLELLLSKDPKKRFQTGNELAKAIQAFEKTGKSQKRKTTTTIEAEAVAQQSQHSELIIDDHDESEAFDDLHTENRYQTLEVNSKSKLPLIVGVISVVVIGAGAFTTKDRWYPQVSQLILGEQPVVTASNDILASKDGNKVNTKQVLETEKAQPLANSNAQNDAPNAGKLLQEADALVQFLPHNINDMKKALKLISAVNAIEPNNKNAQLIYQNILSTSLMEATAQAEKNNFEVANEWIALVKFEEPEYALLGATATNVENLKAQYDTAQSDRSKKENRVNELLKKGELALAEKRLSSPQGDNAISYFEQVLQLEPDNQKAKDKLVSVANAYEKLIEESISERAFSKAKTLLTRYNSLSDDQLKKNQIRQNISEKEKVYLVELEARKKKAALAEKARQEELARQEKLNDPMVQMQLLGSLDSARNLEKQGVLVMPEGNNAVAKYRMVLALDHTNQEASVGLKRIEEKIKSNLSQFIIQSDKRNANLWLTKLKLFQDEHPEYMVFYEQVTQLPDEIIDDKVNESEPVKVENKPEVEDKPVEQKSETNIDNKLEKVETSEKLEEKSKQKDIINH